MLNTPGQMTQRALDENDPCCAVILHKPLVMENAPYATVFLGSHFGFDDARLVRLGGERRHWSSWAAFCMGRFLTGNAPASADYSWMVAPGWQHHVEVGLEAALSALASSKFTLVFLSGAHDPMALETLLSTATKGGGKVILLDEQIDGNSELVSLPHPGTGARVRLSDPWRQWDGEHEFWSGPFCYLIPAFSPLFFHRQPDCGEAIIKFFGRTCDIVMFAPDARPPLPGSCIELLDISVPSLSGGSFILKFCLQEP